MAKEETLGTRIRGRRTAMGMSQLDLAIEAGLMPASLSRIENDHVKPRRETLAALAAALHVHPTALTKP